MKKNFLLSFCFARGVVQVPAQWINNLSVSPPAPTTADSITLYAECSFPYGSCNPSLVSFNRSGNDFYGDALHCMGMLTVICDYTDTFAVGQLAAGTAAVWLISCGLWAAGAGEREPAASLLGGSASCLAHALVLAIPAGWAIGYGLGYLVVTAMASETYRIPLVVSPNTYFWTALITAVAAAASSMLVRRRLNRMDLIAVLKTRE